MTEAQIKHMVEQFLRWRLPETFNPDGGITFERHYLNGTPNGGSREPVGTNLFDYTQATAMVQHMLEGIPDGGKDPVHVGSLAIDVDTSQIEGAITACERLAAAATDARKALGFLAL